MTLSIENNFPRRTFGPGIYINEATIVAVADMTGVQLPFLKEPVDIGFKLTLDIGKTFQPELTIVGNFKREITGEVIGWGSAFVVQDALARLGYTGNLEGENRIAPGTLDMLIGKKFLRLSYVSGTNTNNGKFRYTDWNQIATVEDGPDSLARRFQRSLQRGYPKNYHPELLDEAVPFVPSNGSAIEDSF